MSTATKHDASEPEMKKQRVDGAVSVTTSGARPHPADGPMDDEVTAREKLEKAGFDPNDVTAFKKVKIPSYDEGMRCRWEVNPMIHFCATGDLRMCRYLLSEGASTTADHFWFPMYAAAYNKQLEACKWLYNNGAANDLRRSNEETSSVLGVAFDNVASEPQEKVCADMVLWMILNGAMSHEIDPRKIDDELMKKEILASDSDAGSSVLLTMARQQMENHRSLIEFLKGTLTPPAFSASLLPHILAKRLRSKEAAEMLLQTTPQDQYHSLWEKLHLPRHQSILQCLCGKVGILDQIAEFAGAPRGTDVPIIRCLVDRLPHLIEIQQEVQRERERHEKDINSSSSSSISSDGHDTSPEWGHMD